MTEKYNSIITLNNLNIKAHIGVGDEERAVLQDLKISFKIAFEEMPKACETDNVDDTVCYYKIANIIKTYCNSYKFNLLEYLCFKFHEQIKQNIECDIKNKVWVMVEKCNPPIEDFSGNTCFEYSDF